MKKATLTLIVILTSVCGSFTFAGSPLISTRFYSAFYMNEKVQYAEQLESLDGVIAGYLNEQNTTIDQKIAVINALQWNEKGKNNIETFKMFLGRKYGKSFNQLNLDQLTGDELLCLGYMISLDHQSKLADALPILDKAKAKNSTSYTTQLICSMALAQNYISTSKDCEAWKVCDGVRNNPNLVQDFNSEAIAIIFEQVDTYKDKCN
jgi:hypothetical protein